MRLFIVGASGVIGRSLVPRLVERGDEVVALVRSLERAEPIAHASVRLVQGDLLEIDEAQLTALMSGCDATLHLATALRPGSPGLGVTNTLAALRGEGTAKFLRAALGSGVSRHIQQSIAFAYEDMGEEWIDESVPLARDADGGPSVIEKMESLLHAIEPRRLQWTLLRGGSFTGPDTFQDRMISRLRSGEERIAGDGSNWVSYLHVEDYALAILASLDADAGGRTLNITAEPVRQIDYITRVSELIGAVAPRPSGGSTPRSYRCSNRAAREAIGWAPVREIWPSPEQITLNE
jgi:nucleoside-diphosphate-sugar epimerase